MVLPGKIGVTKNDSNLKYRRTAACFLKRSVKQMSGTSSYRYFPGLRVFPAVESIALFLSCRIRIPTEIVVFDLIERWKKWEKKSGKWKKKPARRLLQTSKPNGARGPTATATVPDTRAVIIIFDSIRVYFYGFFFSSASVTVNHHCTTDQQIICCYTSVYDARPNKIILQYQC